MPRPIHATIYPQAITHNLRIARQATAHANAKLWAVIKANAYGHGIERIFSGLHEADGLAMLDFDEAQRVRALGWDKPILMLEGCFEPNDYQLVRELDLIPVVHQVEQIEWLETVLHSFSGGLSRFTPIYLKLNTDMSRVGFEVDEYATAFDRLRAHHAIGEITLMTHFANADCVGGTENALTQFNRAAAPIFARYPHTPTCLANSAAVLTQAQTHSDWVRPGIMIYGASPFAAPNQTAAAFDLQPAMALHSRIIATRTIAAGQAVGYGSRFTAPQPMRIGVVACGYADGYPRHAADGTPVLVDGVRTRLIGRVSMDMFTVDLSGIPTAQVGSAVELWGKHISIDEVAQSAGTIGYELMCALASRVAVSVDNGHSFI